MRRNWKLSQNKILDSRDESFFIHYSCESLNDSNECLSPRITSIVVLNFGKEQAESFSIHLSAESLGIKRDDIKNHYDEIEKDLLTKFNEFLASNIESSYWIHWNMSNITYGFAHIEHRYNVLTGLKMTSIPDKNKFNLSHILKERYGKNYADNPKLKSLMDLNKDKPREFLSGEEEVEAFQHGEYIKMHKSTLCKVYYFRSIFNKMAKNKLKTKKKTFFDICNIIFDSFIIRLIAVVCTLCTFIGIICKLLNIFHN